RRFPPPLASKPSELRQGSPKRRRREGGRTTSCRWEVDADMPEVSVIMPAFDAERYLPAAIDSVLRQTNADLELLIVDDGSSDETAQIARWYAARDPRVRVLQQPNAGPGPARNTGFRAAQGRYLAFLDSDDEWDATFL